MIKLFDLKVGNFVHVVSRSSGKVTHEDVTLTLDKLVELSKNEDNITIGGIQITDLGVLVSKLGFYLRNSTDPKNVQVIDAVLSVIMNKDSCYFVFAKMDNGQCIISIEHEKEVLCSARVRYIHQVQNLISTIIE